MKPLRVTFRRGTLAVENFPFASNFPSAWRINVHYARRAEPAELFTLTIPEQKIILLFHAAFIIHLIAYY